MAKKFLKNAETLTPTPSPMQYTYNLKCIMHLFLLSGVDKTIPATPANLTGGMEQSAHVQQEQNSHKSNVLSRVTDNQLGVWYDIATGVDSLEIDIEAPQISRRN